MAISNSTHWAEFGFQQRFSAQHLQLLPLAVTSDLQGRIWVGSADLQQEHSPSYHYCLWKMGLKEGV